MKKRYIFFLIIFILINCYAQNVYINQDSIISCDNKNYGQDKNYNWYLVQKKNNKWVTISAKVKAPSCYTKKPNDFEEVSFSRCVDGDTAKLIINNEEKIVRFLAIDTPESVKPDTPVDAYGKEASNFTCNKLTNSKKIILEYDSYSDKEDKYERVLAFVYVDGILLQKELVKNGYAKVAYLYSDYDHIDELKEAEEYAKTNKLGIWKVETNEKNFWEKVKEIIQNIWSFIIKVFA